MHWSVAPLKKKTHSLSLVDLTAPCTSGLHVYTPPKKKKKKAAAALTQEQVQSIWNNPCFFVHHHLFIPTSLRERVTARQHNTEVAKWHVSPRRLMGNCLTWDLAAEEGRLCLSLPLLLVHRSRPRRLFSFSFESKAQRRKKAVLGLLKDVPGERRGRPPARVSAGERALLRLRESGSSLQTSERQARSERAARGMQLLGRTPGGGVSAPNSPMVATCGEGAPCAVASGKQLEHQRGPGGDLRNDSRDWKIPHHNNTVLTMRIRVLEVVREGPKLSPVHDSLYSAPNMTHYTSWPPHSGSRVKWVLTSAFVSADHVVRMHCTNAMPN